MNLRRALDHSAGMSLFQEQPSLLMRVVLLAALALCLMVLDSRLQMVPVVRQAVSAVITPLERAAQKPVDWFYSGYTYFSGVEQARVEEDTVRVKLAQQSLRAALVEDLMLENQRLRALLELRERQQLTGRAAQVLYEVPDPYSQRLIVDRGAVHGIYGGSPVLDEYGVLGQVTQVSPLTSEVMLLTNQKFTISVLNARTDTFGLLYGVPDRITDKATGSLELRFMPVSADVREGDLLITTGIDGIYPSGLPVARVTEVTKSSANSFATIWCEPVAGVHNTRYVMLVEPASRTVQKREEIWETPEDASPLNDSGGTDGE